MTKRKLEKTEKEKPEEIPEEDKAKQCEDALETLTRQMKAKIKREIRASFRDPAVISYLIDNQTAHWKKFNKNIRELLDQRTADMLEEIKEMRKLHETAEETLRNVLLAIRQNEYLQAWYPAQQGYPEMKVVGQHPLKHDRKKRASSPKR